MSDPTPRTGRATIRRELLPFEQRFTQVPNAWARDRRVSARARGVLTELLSHSSGWQTSLQELTTPTEGIAAIRSAVRELEAAGYLVRHRVRERGVWQPSEWVLHDPHAMTAHGG